LRAGRQGVHRGGARRHRVVARRGGRRPADRSDRDAVVGLFLDRLQGRRRLLDPRHHAHLPAAGPARPARRREGLTMPATWDAAAVRARLWDAARDAGPTAVITFFLLLPL